MKKLDKDIVKKDHNELEDSSEWVDIRKFATVCKRSLAFSKRAELPLRERKMRQLSILDALSRITS